MNYTRPQLAIEIEPIKKAFIDAKSRGVGLRYLTEITKDNISYCKELMKIVDELRHLDGIKGNFMISSESEYLAPVILFEKGKIASEIIYSNVEELVEQQQYIFDTFWSRAIPAEQKIGEIERGMAAAAPPNYETKVLENRDQIFKSIKALIDNSDELLVCSDFDGMQMIYNNFFDCYKRVLDKYKRGEQHAGIRWIGTLDKKEDRSDLIQIFLDLGVQIRHVKNILPINFAIGGKKEEEVHATIEYTEGGNLVKSLLVSNEPAYIKHFSSIFEELWKNSLIL